MTTGRAGGASDDGYTRIGAQPMPRGPESGSHCTNSRSSHRHDRCRLSSLATLPDPQTSIQDPPAARAARLQRVRRLAGAAATPAHRAARRRSSGACVAGPDRERHLDAAVASLPDRSRLRRPRLGPRPQLRPAPRPRSEDEGAPARDPSRSRAARSASSAGASAESSHARSRAPFPMRCEPSSRWARQSMATRARPTHGGSTSWQAARASTIRNCVGRAKPRRPCRPRRSTAAATASWPGSAASSSRATTPRASR